MGLGQWKMATFRRGGQKYLGERGKQNIFEAEKRQQIFSSTMKMQAAGYW
jgi:hypothetical protein